MKKDNVVINKGMDECRVLGCTKNRSGDKPLCAGHYEHYQKHGESGLLDPVRRYAKVNPAWPTKPEIIEGECPIIECDRESEPRRMLCYTHGYSFEKYGDPLTTEFLQAQNFGKRNTNPDLKPVVKALLDDNKRLQAEIDRFEAFFSYAGVPDITAMPETRIVERIRRTVDRFADVA